MIVCSDQALRYCRNFWSGLLFGVLSLGSVALAVDARGALQKAAELVQQGRLQEADRTGPSRSLRSSYAGGCLFRAGNHPLPAETSSGKR